MKIPKLFLFSALVLICSEVQSAEKQQETFVFDGYVLSDSLDYNAGSIKYIIAERKLIMTGNATVTYLGRTLKSHKIIYYQDYDYMEAVGEQDSSGNYINTPVFTETNGEELKGKVIKYNLKTQKGYVLRGKSKYESGFMTANKIKLASEDTLFIANGIYTTCDIEEHPHFYFAGNRMKLIVNEKLIIKPIIGYLHDIPVFWFPFYVFPIKKGRQSGFLTPRYGSSRRDGRYLSNIGYYFATSDFSDYKIAGTFRERNGWLANNWLNYNIRDRISGSVFGSFENRNQSGVSSRQWKVSASHSQTVSPTLSISGRGKFESSKFSRYNSRNLFERLNRDMQSNLSIRKTWKESGNSLITTMTYQKNLDTNSTETTLPDISFRKRRKALLGSDSKKKRRKYTQLDMDTEKDIKWYKTIYYSLNARMRNAVTDANTIPKFSRQADFSTNISSSNKLMGWLVTEPSLNLRENFLVTNKTVLSERYQRKDNLSAGLKLGTTIYGMFKPSIGNLVAIRHVVTPSVSYSYGKRRSFYDKDADAFFRFDKNDEQKSRVSSMNLNLRNVFQAKTMRSDKDKKPVERKIDLFNLNFSTAVDFERDVRPISPLQTTLNFKVMKSISSRLTARHNFYHEDDAFHLFNPYLENASITTDIGLSQKMGFQGTSRRVNANTNLGRDDFDNDLIESSAESEETSKSSAVPIKFNISHSYSIRRIYKTGKDEFKKTHYIRPTLSFSPSHNFSVNYNCQYDIENKSMVFQRVIINRDLHCWEANISWVPAGIHEGFYFKVNIKNIPDVKIEKRRGTSRISY